MFIGIIAIVQGGREGKKKENEREMKKKIKRRRKKEEVVQFCLFKDGAIFFP